MIGADNYKNDTEISRLREENLCLRKVIKEACAIHYLGGAVCRKIEDFYAPLAEILSEIDN